MKRIIETQVNAGRKVITDRRDMTISELCDLITLYDEDPTTRGLQNVILNAFYFGVSQGYKIGRDKQWQPK